MMDWLTAIEALAGEPAVLVTVARVEGSAPRETGAKLVVTRQVLFDTIGGGHLEWRAAEVARDMLDTTDGGLAAERRLLRVPLGPALGQCCGGVVHLAFERLHERDASMAMKLSRAAREGMPMWRLVRLDAAQPSVLLDQHGDAIDDAYNVPPPPDLPDIALDAPCHVLQDDDDRLWLADPCQPPRAHLILFGAGHVGAALVRALAELPCRVTWVDEREDQFPATVPANVCVEATDTPLAVVDAAPAGASYLVMTHSHALDQMLAEAILRRGDAGWFGLIGSLTKRRQFEHRLRDRGLPPERLADMVCPIGLPGISGKAPAIIAASVCAQLLGVWEQAAQCHAQRQPQVHATHAACRVLPE